MALQNFVDNSLPTIKAAWLNAVDSIQNVVTGSAGGIAVTGTLYVSGVSSFAAGSFGAPSIYMTGYATTGWYNIGANNWGFAVSGAKVLDIASTGLSVTGTLSSTGDYKIAGTGIYNAIATNTSLGLFADTNAYAGIKAYGSSHATKANVTELLAGTGVVVGSVSSTGLAVTGTIGATSTLTSAVAAGSAAFTMGAAARFYLDGSVDTFITESSGNNIQFVTGGSAVVNMNTTGLAVTGEISATGDVTASGGNLNLSSGGTFPIRVTGATTTSTAARFTNTGGDSIFGAEGNSTNNLIVGCTAYDTIIRGPSGIAFSANAGSAMQMRLSSTGLAVTGTTSTTSFFETTEIAAPAAGAANTARIFAVDNGSGKTVLKVQFATGAAQIIATEP